MIRNTKFWTSMAVFQLLFGFAVFAITRDYYIQDTDDVGGHSSTTASTSAPVWPTDITKFDAARLSTSVFSDAALQNPAEILRRGDEFFVNRQYERALDAYGRLLTLDPKNVEMHNNVGLTLHYLGRSDEALRTLNDGIALDPEHQRIWLTLGYVNSQLGNSREARTALTRATTVGTDPTIKQSATKMLEALP